MIRTEIGFVTSSTGIQVYQIKVTGIAVRAHRRSSCNGQHTWENPWQGTLWTQEVYIAFKRGVNKQLKNVCTLLHKKTKRGSENTLDENCQKAGECWHGWVSSSCPFPGICLWPPVMTKLARCLAPCSLTSSLTFLHPEYCKEHRASRFPGRRATQHCSAWTCAWGLCLSASRPAPQQLRVPGWPPGCPPAQRAPESRCNSELCILALELHLGRLEVPEEGKWGNCVVWTFLLQKQLDFQEHSGA